jgi:hypothetical protein
MTDTTTHQPSKATQRRQQAMMWAAEQQVVADHFHSAEKANKQQARQLEQRLADQQLADDALRLVAAAAAMRNTIEMKGHTCSPEKQRRLTEQLQQLDAALLTLADAWAAEIENHKVKLPRTLDEALEDVRAAQAKEDELLYGSDGVTAADDVLFIV